MMRPALATTAIFHVLGVWNDFFAALVFINSENDRTLQLAASVFRGSFGTNYQYLLGGVVLSMLPSAVFYLLVQDKIIEGVAAGAVKG
jgi:raffinose/stachyose/melibiose transport system permease protein